MIPPLPCSEASVLSLDERPPCPVATTLRLIGNKWKIFLIWRLLERERRFGELLREIPGISQKVLTENLRALEEDGMIVRTVHPVAPPRVEYALSQLGESMRPVLQSMADWGSRYQELAREKRSLG